MTTDFKISEKNYSTSIREIDLNGVKAGGENSLLFMHNETKVSQKPLIACEILMNIPKSYPELLKQEWGDTLNNPVNCAKAAVDSGADILAVRFNIEEVDEIPRCKEILKEIQTTMPLIITGSFKRELDKELLPELAKTASRKCTIGVVEEENFKEITPAVMENGHNIISRTPIDINLTKQLNILITEMGFDADKILIDPNTGGLGYGLDYAYSIIERIKVAALSGDTMLNMPVITFVGEEAWKTKESKSTQVPKEWGEFRTRAISWECITASSMLVSGSNIVVMRHPESIKYIKNFIAETYNDSKSV